MSEQPTNILSSLKQEYSSTNPIAYHAGINQLIKEINNLSPAKSSETILNEKIQKLKDEILLAMRPESMKQSLERANLPALPPLERLLLMIPTFEDEVVKHLRSNPARQLLRKELHLIKEGDLVCDVSQGLFANGQNACAVICWHAAETFLSDTPPTTENDILRLIKKGVETYNGLTRNFPMMFGDKGMAYVEELADKIADDKGKPTLKPIVPKQLDFVENLQVILEMNGTIPFQGDPSKDFLSTIKALKEVNQDQKSAGFITCNGETVLVGFGEDGKPFLFDSHGRTYQEVSKGASVLTFDSVEKIAQHLSQVLFLNATPKAFTCMFVTSTKKLETATKAAQEPSEEQIVSHAHKLFDLSKNIEKVMTTLKVFYGEQLQNVRDLFGKLISYAAKHPHGPSKDETTSIEAAESKKYEKELTEALQSVDSLLESSQDHLSAVESVVKKSNLHQAVVYNLLKHYLKSPEEGGLPDAVILLAKDYLKKGVRPADTFKFVTSTLTGLNYMQQRSLVMFVFAPK